MNSVPRFFKIVLSVLVLFAVALPVKKSFGWEWPWKKGGIEKRGETTIESTNLPRSNVALQNIGIQDNSKIQKDKITFKQKGLGGLPQIQKVQPTIKRASVPRITRIYDPKAEKIGAQGKGLFVYKTPQDFLSEMRPGDDAILVDGLTLDRDMTIEGSTISGQGEVTTVTVPAGFKMVFNNSNVVNVDFDVEPGSLFFNNCTGSIKVNGKTRASSLLPQLDLIPNAYASDLPSACIMLSDSSMSIGGNMCEGGVYATVMGNSSCSDCDITGAEIGFWLAQGFSGGAKLTLSGGNVHANTIGIYMDSNSDLELNGSNIYENELVGITGKDYTTNGTPMKSGATIEMNAGSNVFVNDRGIELHKNGKLTLNGGSLIGSNSIGVYTGDDSVVNINNESVLHNNMVAISGVDYVLTPQKKSKNAAIVMNSKSRIQNNEIGIVHSDNGSVTLNNSQILSNNLAGVTSDGSTQDTEIINKKAKITISNNSEISANTNYGINAIEPQKISIDNSIVSFNGIGVSAEKPQSFKITESKIGGHVTQMPDSDYYAPGIRLYDGKLDISNSQIKDNKLGILVVEDSDIISTKNNYVSNGTGVWMAMQENGKISKGLFRNNFFNLNDIGISVWGGTPDLGTFSDLGSNLFVDANRCNIFNAGGDKLYAVGDWWDWQQAGTSPTIGDQTEDTPGQYGGLACKGGVDVVAYAKNGSKVITSIVDEVGVEFIMKTTEAILEYQKKQAQKAWQVLKFLGEQGK